MSKHNMLTAEEISKFVIESELLEYIEPYRNKMNLEKQELNILDWGCGRGRSVLRLREQGYNAFGVDIDPEPIKNGRVLFLKRGFDAKTILTLVNPDGKINFPDNSFHFVFSEHVFEHVQDIESVAAEIQRVTTPGGLGLHRYPASKEIVEGHLHLPFVHWLPKNGLRKALIFIFLLIGQDPKWEELQGKSIYKRTQTYFGYSIHKTYYRSPRTIRQVFKRNGFDVDFVTINNPKLRKLGLLYKLIRAEPWRSIVNWGLTTFKLVELFTIKVTDYPPQ